MFKSTVGMAIKITEANREKLSVVNVGVVPEIESDLVLYAGVYFVFPYDSSAHCTILPGYAFHENYQFAEAENENHFVEIYEK